MSKKKGLSVDEKRERMLQLFYEKKDVFQLKDLEKIAPKEKGIVAQTVKDIVQSLVDDGLIDTDKIGTSVYFWAFPSKAVSKRKNKIEELDDQLSSSRKKLKTLEEEIAKSQSGREETDERLELLSELEGLRKEREGLKSKVQEYQDCDPEVLEEKKKLTKVAQEAINRWTDNIFAIKSWCKKKFFIEDSVMNKQFGIPEDLDYLP